MSEISYPPPRPLGAGEVLDLTFRIYRATLVKCLLFGALGVLGNSLPNLYSASKGQSLLQSVFAPSPDPVRTLLAILGGLVALAFSVAILRRQYQIVTGRPLGGELATGFRLLPRLVLFFILYGLAFAACGLLLIPAALTHGVTQWLFIVLWLAPFGYVVVALSCGYPSLIVDDTGAVESLKRSWRLTRGSFWRLSAIYTVAIILMFVLYIVTGAVATFLYGILGRGDIAVVSASVAVVMVLIGALAAPFYSALLLAVLGDLSVRSEGADLAQRIAAA